MPIPFPANPPAPQYPPAVEPRQNPYWLAEREGWAQTQVRDSHVQALNEMGEYALFTLMWYAKDHADGLVDVCQTCTLSANQLGRMSAAYEQPTREKCPDCFGTHFEGGYRAQIIRPSLWTDSNTDTEKTRRGEVTTDAMVIETTEDFSFRHGDYVFRANGARYQGEELSSAWIRAGFDVPDDAKSVAGQISQARLEDPSSVAYLLPPTADVLSSILRVPAGTHFTPDFSASETVRGPLIR
jgi:hypothetical protein